ncbi:23349_t:CDS:2 [Cetraspora pellucida]|uniref:23349_t:CDS:1 n=1 Tax=Cetraspora pellucida TaxID=1433469 RepID=A0A9N9FWL2_9GLOM|nr:23349_t:CDS:2 [Cetraspora pellucida]
MCDSESIYSDFEYSSSKESSQDNFIADKVNDTLENAWLLLDNNENNYEDYDFEENDNSKDSNENIGEYNENIDDNDESINDKNDNNNINVKSKHASIQDSSLTPCVVIGIINSKIMSVGESCNQKFKEKLLLLLMPTLQSLNNNKKDNKKVKEELPNSLFVKTSLKMTEIDPIDPPSSFFVKMTLKIVKIDLSKLKEKSYNIISEKVTDIEKNKNEFEIEDIHLEITKKIPLGSNIPVNVVILETGNPPNCNNNFHASCEMYHKDLSICETAFASLFPAVGKSKYASSTVHFLAQVHNDSQLRKLLEIVCSVNHTCEDYYLGFNKTLETYDVKFIKQNIFGNLMNEETIMLKIKAA